MCEVMSCVVEGPWAGRGRMGFICFYSVQRAHRVSIPDLTMGVWCAVNDLGELAALMHQPSLQSSSDSDGDASSGEEPLKRTEEGGGVAGDSSSTQEHAQGGEAMDEVLSSRKKERRLPVATSEAKDGNDGGDDIPAAAKGSEAEEGSEPDSVSENSEDETTAEASEDVYARQNEQKRKQDELESKASELENKARKVREKYAEFVHEAMISAQIGNKEHVVGFTGADLSPRRPLLVFKFMPGKDLSRYLRERKRTGLGMKVLASMLCQAASGLWAVHRAGIIHRDVAARNFLVGKNNYVCIADFGLSKQLPKGKAQVLCDKDDKLPSMWTAPEARSKRVGSFKSDVFMFGVFLYECFRLEPFPYPELLQKMGKEAHGYVATQVVKHGLRPDLDKLDHRMYDGLSEGLLKRYKGLMERCWKQEPRERPTMKNVFQELESIKG